MDRLRTSRIIDRIIAWSVRYPFSTPVRYLLATVAVAVGALTRVILITGLLPWLIFMPIVLLVGLTMGRRTGLYAVILSAVLAAISIAHAGERYWLSGSQWAATILYIIIAQITVVIAAELRAAFLRAQQLSDERARIHAQLVEKEEQGQLLNQELGHRLKNLLTIIQAVVSQTLRQSPDLNAASEVIAFRLAAFGRAADVLTANSWQSADLHALARTALSAHPSLAARFRLEGPSIRFQPQVALALALSLHELVTNATKYGALSNETGRVELTWSIENEEGQDRFRLQWREIGGPPVNEPARRGFGSLMIERSLRSYFRGSTEMRFDPDGLVFVIDAPLAGTQAELDDA